MAEPTDRPAENTVTASAPSAAPAASTDPAPVYGSVSLVAVIGFALAALYAGFLLLGGVVALFNHTPMLLPIWTLAIPIAAAAVCWAARTRIRKSEGALSGARLAMWGVGLSLIVGLLYTAYYAGNYMAVTAQAKSFTDQWLDLLKKDQLDRAFMYTLAPEERPADDAGLRDSLELNNDRGGPNGGQLTSFRGSELVRQFQQDAGKADLQFLGVSSWEYNHGSYTVAVAYRVATAAMTVDVQVTAVATDDQNGERQWRAMETHYLKNPAFTSEGDRMALLTGQARDFAQQWLDNIVGSHPDQAYLQTLPPTERDSHRKETESFPAVAASVIGLPGPSLAQGPLAAAATLTSSSYGRYLAGGVVQYDHDKFWVAAGQTDTPARRTLQARKAEPVRAVFSEARKDLPSMMMGRTLPYYSHNGTANRVALDMSFVPNGQIVQAHIVLTADFGSAEPQRDLWRVESLELVSSKTAPQGMPGGAPPANMQRAQ
ncbi:MAG TPA: hypothetical protein VMS17_29670 [Gemmataceae bacterium]|nr:hypothetical protein [Gemmataceae bacterium]